MYNTWGSVVFVHRCTSLMINYLCMFTFTVYVCSSLIFGLWFELFGLGQLGLKSETSTRLSDFCGYIELQTASYNMHTCASSLTCVWPCLLVIINVNKAAGMTVISTLARKIEHHSVPRGKDPHEPPGCRGPWGSMPPSLAECTLYPCSFAI